jgi:single-strand DNA-binding protein
MNVNKAIVMGNLTRDPEVRNTPSGQNVASFGLATNRFWTSRENGEKKKQTEYHNIIAWGKLADVVQRFLKKGNLAYVEGRLQTRNWQDQEGNKKSRTEIVAETIQLGPKPLDSSRQDNHSNDKEEDHDDQEDVSSPGEINVEEIPF